MCQYRKNEKCEATQRGEPCYSNKAKALDECVWLTLMSPDERKKRIKEGVFIPVMKSRLKPLT